VGIDLPFDELPVASSLPVSHRLDAKWTDHGQQRDPDQQRPQAELEAAAERGGSATWAF
jgi:hypothetical protein